MRDAWSVVEVGWVVGEEKATKWRGHNPIKPFAGGEGQSKARVAARFKHGDSLIDAAGTIHIDCCGEGVHTRDGCFD